jgi:hypothetical protein
VCVIMGDEFVPAIGAQVHELPAFASCVRPFALWWAISGNIQTLTG